MMEIDTQNVIYLLLASNALLAGGAALAILKLQNMLRQQKLFWQSPTGAALNTDYSNDGLLDAIDQRISYLKDGTNSPGNSDKQQPDARQVVPFDNAVRMARHGASQDDLIRTCGLSANEARLFMRVHSQRKLSAKGA